MTREPYVGPRPFEEGDRELFFGREQEANDLVSLITAHPVALLYAQSGAGKTSLLKASLIPKLVEEERFNVLPPTRVRSQSQLPAASPEIANIYVFNALNIWNDLPERAGHKLASSQLATMSLADFLGAYKQTLDPDQVEGTCVMIFDQFEELFTHYPERWTDRQGFFEQVAAALKADYTLRVVLAMREDYIADLDPYAHLLPEKLRTRFRMERLRRRAALAAITQPLEADPVKSVGLRFSEGVAETLVDNLLRIRARDDEGGDEILGQFVEPVQLQVVCQSLWQKVRAEGNALITDDHLKTFGDVNQALREFYERGATKAAEAIGQTVGVIHSWVDRHLITSEGARSTIFRGREETCGLPNRAIDVLEKESILRAELRDKTIWYELSQDRLIQPIRESYKHWLLDQPGEEQTRLEMESRAQQWAKTRDRSLLLDQGELLVAQRWMETRIPTGGYSESLFALAQASQAAFDKAEAEAERRRAATFAQMAAEQQKLAEAEKQKAEALEQLAAKERRLADVEHRRVQQFKAGAVVLGLLLLAATGLAMFARQQKYEALAQKTEAETQKAEAQNQRTEADTQRAEAIKQRDAAEKAREEAAIQQGRAEKARDAARSAQARATEAKRVAETALHAANVARAETERQKKLAEEARDEARFAEEVAKKQTKIVEETLRMAQSGALAANALLSLPTDPELGVLLASHATSIGKSAKNEEVLRQAEEVLRRSLLSNARMTMRGHEGAVNSVAVSPDGKRLATASNDHTARIWDVATGQSLVTLRGHTDRVNGVAFSPDGRFVATASDDRTIRLWDAKTWQSLTTLNGYKAAVISVGFSPDGKLIATGSEGGSVRIWEAVAGRPSPLRDFPGHEIGVHSVAFSPDGKFLLTAGPETVKLWDVATGDLLRKLPDTPTHFSVAFSPDGKMFVTAESDGNLHVWDSKTMEMLARWSGHKDSIFMVAFSPDSQYIITASGDDTARIWDARTKTELATLRGHSGGVHGAAFGPDGKFVITAGADKTVRLWDVRGELPVAELRDHASGVSIAAFSPDGQRIVTASMDNTAIIWNWDGATGRSQTKLNGHKGSINDAAFGPDGRLIITASEDRTARLWDAATGEQRGELLQHDTSLFSAAFSPDGKLAVTAGTAGAAGAARIWDLEKRMIVAELREHEGSVYGAAFSPGFPTSLYQKDDFGSFSMTTKMTIESGGQIEATTSIDNRLSQKGACGTVAIWLWFQQGGSRFVKDKSVCADGQSNPFGSSSKTEKWDISVPQQDFKEIHSISIIHGESGLKPDSAKADQVRQNCAIYKLVGQPVPIPSAVELIRKGSSLNGAGMFKDAIAYLDQALSIDPNLFDGYYLRADAYHSLGQLEMAEKNLNEAMQRNSKYVPARMLRGDLFRQLKQYGPAVKDYSEVINLGWKGNVVAYINRGRAFYGLGQFNQAIDDFNKAISINSTIRGAYYHLGLAHYSNKKYDLAIENYTKALTIKPKAKVHLEDRTKDRIDPEDSEIYYQRGKAHQESANQDFERSKQSSNKPR